MAANLPIEPIAADRLGKAFLKAARVILVVETDIDLTVGMAGPLGESAPAPWPSPPTRRSSAAPVRCKLPFDAAMIGHTGGQPREGLH